MTQTWHYAVSRERTDDDEEIYSIREVYVDDEDPTYLAYSADAVKPMGETPAELLEELDKMGAAFKRKMLDLTYSPPQLVAWKGEG